MQSSSTFEGCADSIGHILRIGDFFMRIYQAKDYADMSRKAANIVSAQVIMKPNCVLGLATGSTPIGLYKQLVEWFKKGIWTSQRL